MSFGDKLVKVTYSPFKEVVIKEYVRFDKLDDLIFIFAQFRGSGMPVSLNWANGIVFSFVQLDPAASEELIEEYLQGKVYWVTVIFALMPHYKPLVEIQKTPVPVINMNYNAIYREVADWLKQQK